MSALDDDHGVGFLILAEKRAGAESSLTNGASSRP